MTDKEIRGTVRDLQNAMLKISGLPGTIRSITVDYRASGAVRLSAKVTVYQWLAEEPDAPQA
jgi:hypothetical protein